MFNLTLLFLCSSNMQVSEEFQGQMIAACISQDSLSMARDRILTQLLVSFTLEISLGVGKRTPTF